MDPNAPTTIDLTLFNTYVEEELKLNDLKIESYLILVDAVLEEQKYMPNPQKKMRYSYWLIKPIKVEHLTMLLFKHFWETFNNYDMHVVYRNNYGNNRFIKVNMNYWLSYLNKWNDEKYWDWEDGPMMEDIIDSSQVELI